MRKLNPASAALFVLALSLLVPDLGTVGSWPTSWPAISWPWPIVAPAPFKTDKPLALLILEENDERNAYTPGQLEAMQSLAGPGSVHAVVDAIPGAEFRLLDKDQTDFSRDQPWVAEAFKVAAEKNVRPWIVVSTAGGGGFSKQMPAKAEDVVADLKALGAK